MNLSNDNIVYIKKDGVEFLQFRKLLEYSDIIRHAYSLGTDVNFRTFKIKSLQEEEKPLQCYKKLCDALGSDYKRIVKPNQLHTGNVQNVEKKVNKDFPDINLEKYKKTDGVITSEKNIILSTTNADCILLLFFDPIKKVIANVHSGWKGTLKRISVKTVIKMKEKYNSNPKDIICCICPSIRKCHFEVQKDVKDLYSEEFNNAKCFIEETIPNFKWHIDTVAINKELLKEQGLKEENIIDSNICSVCNSNIIHSYRAEGKNYGLETAIIELK